MPEIRTVQYTDRKIAVIEDPNPTFSRIFLDTVQHDLVTLTPSWTKSWHYNYQGIQWHATGNSSYVFVGSFGPGQGIQRNITNSLGNQMASMETNIYFPVTDDGFFRAGIMCLSRGTISTYAVGDQSSNYAANTNIAANAMIGGSRAFNNFQHDTYHQTMDFANYPMLKLARVANNTQIVAILPGDRGLGGMAATGAGSSPQQYNPFANSSGYNGNANDGWFLYGTDITAGIGATFGIPGLTAFLTGGSNNPPQVTLPLTEAEAATAAGGISSRNNIGGTWGFGKMGSSIAYEDAGNGAIYLMNNANPSKPYVNKITGYTTLNPVIIPVIGAGGAGGTNSSLIEPNGIANNSQRIFFAGVDNTGNTLWVVANDHPTRAHAVDCGITVNRLSSQNNFFSNVSFVHTAANQNTHFSSYTGERLRRLSPSNMRRDAADATRWVFYTPHYDAGTATNPGNFPGGSAFGNANLVPLRWTININTGNVSASYCNIAYLGSNTHWNIAAPMVMNMNQWTPDTANNTCPWGMKPHQFVSNGNTYITFWITDQMALSSTGQGARRWPTPNTRTMITYQAGTGTNDNQLTYHSAYTFFTLQDIPKNFMPLNANSTQMIVPQTYKTSFFVWENATGWRVGSVYNSEFRTLGMDATNRIWGYAMDKNNGSIHIITPTLPVNVAVIMSGTNFTYTGTTISATATVNAYDYTGNRLAANVQLSIDGSTMLFATNSSRNLTVATSNTADTVVPVNITGGGINNIYAAISV